MKPRPIEDIRNSYDDERPLPGVAYRDEGIFAAEAETLLRDRTQLSPAWDQAIRRFQRLWARKLLSY